MSEDTPPDRLESLFHQAVEASPEERARLLREVQERDPALADELLDLLRYHDTGTERVEELRRRLQDWSGSVRDATDGKAASTPAAMEGRVVGPYRIRGLLGRGGMGAVYRAERADGTFEQEVALKLLPVGLDAPAARERFRRERQILARLRHPGIAQIHDGGITPDGTPWFAMELVEGVAIDRYCDAHRLGLSDRIRLFLQVCQAVAHAHGRLVLHRDLKPGNILVTGDGDVKLLDFGVARLLGDEDRTSLATRVGVPATPAWASPEQLRGEGTAGVTADVYGLGAVLYHLLTGVGIREAGHGERPSPEERVPPPDRAFHAAGDERTDIAAARATDPGALERVLSSDLKWVLLRALEPRPEQRYTSVAELRDDLVRYLDRRPVQAHPDSRRYHLVRWAQRNWGAVAAGVILLVGGVVATAGWVRALRAEDEARAQAARSQAVSGFLEGIFQLAVDDPQAARTVSAADVLEQGVDEARTALGDVPEAQVLILESLGQAFLGLGLPGRADSVLAEAMAVADSRLDPADPSRASIRSRRALLAVEAGIADQARRWVEEAEGVVAAGDDVDWELKANLDWARGEVHLAGGRYDSARLAVEAAVRRARQATGEGYVPPRFLLSLGRIARVTGDLPEAERRYRAALEFARDSLPQSATQYGFALDGLAAVLFEDPSADRREEALTLRLEALEELEARLGSDHPRMVGMLNNAGAAAHFMGRMDEAVTYYRRALAVAETLPGQSIEVLRILGNIGVAERLRFRPAAAEASLREAIARNRDAGSGPTRALLAKHWTDLGLVLWEANRFTESRSALDRALALNEAEFGPDSPQLAYGVYQLMLLGEARGRPAEALIHGRRLLMLLEGSGNRAALRTVEQSLAWAHLSRGAVDSARVYLDRAEPGPEAPDRKEWVWIAAAVADARGLGTLADSLRDEGVGLAALGGVEETPAAVAYAEARRAAARDSLGTALAHLERAASLGLRTLRPRRDDELAPVRGDPRFQAALERIRQRLWEVEPDRR